MQNFDLKAASILKAIAYAENGGHPDIANPKSGKTGELKSIFQFEPGTWKLYSREVSGDPNLTMTPENETAVTYGKISSWLKQGYNTEQIASIWNAGNPDAYKEAHKGVNKKYGVSYDTPAYAKKVSDYATKFEKEAPGPGISNDGNSAISQPMIQPTSPQPMTSSPQSNQAKSPTLPQLMQKQAKQT